MPHLQDSHSDGRSRIDVLEDLVVQAKLTDTMAIPSDMEKQALARIWREALKAVPTEELEPCFYAAIAHDQHRTPRPQEVLAAWNRNLIAAPRETFQEKEARETAAQGFKALPSHEEEEMPVYVQAHAVGAGRVACNCVYGSGDFPNARNRKYIDGYRKRAVLSGEKWICGTGKCDFVVDGNDFAAVKRAMIAPFANSPTPEPVAVVPTIAPKSQTRAMLLAEEAERDWDSLSPEVQAEMARLAKWCDWQKPPRVVTPLNFEEIWNEFQVKREAMRA